MTPTPPIPTPDVGRLAARRRGFTLIELLVVMTIIGILISLILVAQADAVRQAEMRATQALILKLEGGLNDRLDALMQMKPLPNYTHAYLGGYYPGGSDVDGYPLMAPPAVNQANGQPDPLCKTLARSQAFALADYLKSEMPDVFFVQAGLSSTPNATDYPFNFAAHYILGTPTEAAAGLSGPLATVHANYILPLGHMVLGPRDNENLAGWRTGYGDSHYYTNTVTGAVMFFSSAPELGHAGRGIYGASYSVAAGLYKNLGYLPTGYDMVDNNGNGLIDEWSEGVDSTNSADVLVRLGSHTHDTARSEMLYALLVEGQGLLGSIFNADDFSDREVKDTDGDGLPEFVDAWGKPLQFYRWPTLYHSDTQRGQRIGPDLTNTSAPLVFLRPFDSTFETREQNPLDPNQSLTAPAFWLSTQNQGYPPLLAGSIGAKGAPTYSSGGVAAFEWFFHRLTEPMEYYVPDPTVSKYWDRANSASFGYRRAFFTKPLILSGGPDGTPGVVTVNPSSYSDPESTAQALISIENTAAQFLPSETMNSSLIIPKERFDMSQNPLSLQLWDSGQDDISNHTVTAAAGSGG
ncbi:type II secretion system protein [Paludisphaera rhizosphaerae]|uniref:type II secretion system protein n=1 Tax=Paludisphaera rhizosphaerae TaxID=2711216 RepID=UPI001981C9EF|nr:prepilin-type N-terminal cleavage/methylation domain-containing protein [Paludisphaera rhizosphaerae]